ncbi:hypothetical protein [Providencia vermicola]|uniref:hypothetical protein n=1 Tax=Providencia vermicola TaxID=333965 RepID=UPI0034E4CDA9
MSDIAYDKIIEKENIGTATLALLTNQDPYSARSAGIFTHQDLSNIHKYIHFALSLPTSTLEILSWLKIGESTNLPIETNVLTETIQLIHRHASHWDSIEQEVKRRIQVRSATLSRLS